jgi:hypothetical protein
MKLTLILYLHCVYIYVIENASKNRMNDAMIASKRAAFPQNSTFFGLGQ